MLTAAVDVFYIRHRGSRRVTYVPSGLFVFGTGRLRSYAFFDVFFLFFARFYREPLRRCVYVCVFPTAMSETYSLVGGEGGETEEKNNNIIL